MVEHCKLWLCPREYDSRLFRFGVVRKNELKHGRGEQLWANSGHLVDQKIGASRMLYKVFVEAGISRNDGRASAIVNAKPKRRFDEIAMVDFEGSDFHPIVVVHNAFFDFCYGN